MKYEEPFLFDANAEPDATYAKTFHSVLFRVFDKLRHYEMSSLREDVMKIMQDKDCNHRRYESARVTSLLKLLTTCLDDLNVINNTQEEGSLNTKVVKDDIETLISQCEKVCSTVEKEEDRHAVWDDVKELKQNCSKARNSLLQFKPQIKSRLHEFTDAGPGVGISNNDVKIRMVETVMIWNLDFYIRHHLANDDSSHNEVERCQSYVGDAICDGGSIEWEELKEFEGLDEGTIANMSMADLEEHEHARMRKNAFGVCKEITLRMDGATAPGGFLKAFVSNDKEDMFFTDHEFLKNYLVSPENKKAALPDGSYYKMLEQFKDSHFEIGEKYAEYVKGACNGLGGGLCSFCEVNHWVGPPCNRIPKPYPNYTEKKFKYLSVFETPVADREVDDYQPRRNARLWYENGDLETNEGIEQFSKTFICPVKLVADYRNHLDGIRIRREKRQDVRKQNREANNEKDFDEFDWVDLFQSGLLKKQTVNVLDKYLNHYQLKHAVKLKKHAKVNFIQGHIATTLVPVNEARDDARDKPTTAMEEDDLTESEAENGSNFGDDSSSTEDDVIRATVCNDDDSEEGDDDSDGESDDNDFAPESIFTKTKSGRVATNYNRVRFM